MMPPSTRIALVVVLLLAALVAPARANTSHAGWPHVTGMLLMNKQDQGRPLDGRPGSDPFGGADRSYSCDGSHLDTGCLVGGPAFAPADLVCTRHSYANGDNGWPGFFVRRLCESHTTSVVPAGVGHNELLGGHGSDTIFAGPRGDVLWGDYKPSGQPTGQSDALHGGAGKDFIYASHGRNEIWTGGGNDVIHAHFGHGAIHCEGGRPTVFLSRKSRRLYKLDGCKRISYKTLGY